MRDRSAVTILSLVLICSLFGLSLKESRANPASPYPRLDVLARAISHIERYYVGQLNEEELIYNAIKGMMRAIDPHSSFLTPSEFKVLQEDTSGRFQGVGIEVGIRDDVLTVIAPIENSPAERADIRPGDRIVKIENKSTRTMNLEGAVQLMRGPEGSSVTITVRRDDVKNDFDVTLVRGKIEMRSVVAEVIEPGFAHVRVRVFQDRTASDLKKALERMKLESGGPLHGIVLDLRRNPGGLLVEAVRVADMFMNEGVIVTTRGRDGAVIESFKAGGKGLYRDITLVMLIDAGSASAAEIVAGALKDSGRSIVVGTRSFGKGSVQSVIPMNNGTGLKLTTSLYFTPSGQSIQATGIVPDVLVESLAPPVPDELTRAMNEMPAERDLPGHLTAESPDETIDNTPAIDDYQLRLAVQILKGLVRSDATKKQR